MTERDKAFERWLGSLVASVERGATYNLDAGFVGMLKAAFIAGVVHAHSDSREQAIKEAERIFEPLIATSEPEKGR